MVVIQLMSASDIRYVVSCQLLGYALDASRNNAATCHEVGTSAS